MMMPSKSISRHSFIVNMIGTKGKANYWFGYVHVAWTDERMFSEQKKKNKKKTVSRSHQNPVMAQSKSCQELRMSSLTTTTT